MFEPKLFKYQYFGAAFRDGISTFAVLRTNLKTTKLQQYMGKEGWKDTTMDYFIPLMERDSDFELKTITDKDNFVNLIGLTNYMYHTYEQKGAVKSDWYDLPIEERQKWCFEILKDKEEIYRMCKITNKKVKKNDIYII